MPSNLSSDPASSNSDCCQRHQLVSLILSPLAGPALGCALHSHGVPYGGGFRLALASGSGSGSSSSRSSRSKKANDILTFVVGSSPFCWCCLLVVLLLSLVMCISFLIVRAGARGRVFPAQTFAWQQQQRKRSSELGRVLLDVFIEFTHWTERYCGRLSPSRSRTNTNTNCNDEAQHFAGSSIESSTIGSGDIFQLLSRKMCSRFLESELLLALIVLVIGRNFAREAPPRSSTMRLNL